MVDTIENVDLLPARQRRKAVVVAVGAPAEWLQAGADRPAPGSGEALRVVFYGLFTPLQGADVIAAAAAQLGDRTDIELTMIGSGQQRDLAHERAAANASVHWVDWVAAADLPGVVRAYDVCLGIFATSAKALRVVPNKVFQGAAAGCAIVTSDTAPQRRALADAAVFVAPGDAGALADALRRLADDRAAVTRLGATARDRAVDSFTATTVVEPLRARLIKEPR
jgi:glycosyltransferase involved in cell wall biosynthesis